MTSRWQATPYFRRYGRELVSKPAISLKKSWGGYRRTTLWYELGRMDFFGLRAVCKKTRKNINELRFLTKQANEIAAFSDFFRCRISDDEVIIRAQQVFHDRSTITPVSQTRTVLP